MQYYGNRGVFLFAAAFPLIVMACSAFALEEFSNDSKKLASCSHHIS